jgi:hypothetical protein
MNTLAFVKHHECYFCGNGIPSIVCDKNSFHTNTKEEAKKEKPIFLNEKYFKSYCSM